MKDTEQQLVVEIAAEIFLRLVAKYDRDPYTVVEEEYRALATDALTAAEAFVQKVDDWKEKRAVREADERRKRDGL